MIRTLTKQLLGDIERDLLVPYTKGASLHLEFEEKVRINHTTTGPIPQVEAKSEVGNVKFGWGISREVGLIAGLAFGKALQLGIRLPFALHSAFYELLIDTRDKTIEVYYSETFSREISTFKQGIINFYNAGSFNELLQILPKPENLQFTKLSTKADTNDARADAESKTNLWSCRNNECYSDIKELQGEGFIAEYIKAILEKTLKEFKEFVHELVRGLGMALPPVKEFTNWPIPILHPFKEFLPKLLNSKSFKAENVLTRVVFDGEKRSLVQSLIKGQSIEAHKVFTAFVLSLGERQLHHLIGIWAGPSIPSLKNLRLKVFFRRPGNSSSYKVNFCDPSNPTTTTTNKRDHHIVLPGEGYQEFSKRFAKNLLSPNVNFGGENCSGKSIDIIPVSISTCSYYKNLIVSLQSAEEMLNSLLDLLYTPL